MNADRINDLWSKMAVYSQGKDHMSLFFSVMADVPDVADQLGSDFSDVKEGDYIWTIQGGWELVANISSGAGYLIQTGERSYFSSGIRMVPNNIDDLYPSAFTVPPACFGAELKPVKFKRGDRVIVFNSSDKVEYRRYFSHMSRGGFYSCFIQGSDEWSSGGDTMKWSNCRLWEK